MQSLRRTFPEGYNFPNEVCKASGKWKFGFSTDVLCRAFSVPFRNVINFRTKCARPLGNGNLDLDFQLTFCAEPSAYLSGMLYLGYSLSGLAFSVRTSYLPELLSFRYNSGFWTENSEDPCLSSLLMIMFFFESWVCKNAWVSRLSRCFS